MKLQGFRPFDIFPSRLDMTPVPLVSNGFFYCTPRVWIWWRTSDLFCVNINQSTISFFLQNRFCIQLLVGVLLNIELALKLLTGDQVSEDTCRKGVRVIYWFSPVRLCSSHQNSVGVTGPQSRGDTSNLLLQLRAAKPDRSIKRNMDPSSEPK